MLSTAPSLSTWCPFCDIPSAAMAAMVAERCRFSLDTLAFARFPESASFALTEHEHEAVWRWAIMNSDGWIIAEGCKPSEREAQGIAETTLRQSAA